MFFTFLTFLKFLFERFLHLWFRMLKQLSWWDGFAVLSPAPKNHSVLWPNTRNTSSSPCLM